MTITFRYWIKQEADGTFSVYRKAPGDPVQDSGFLSGDFSDKASAEDCMKREQEFDASEFGQEFNEALAKEDWS
jgi:hypothetical protein